MINVDPADTIHTGSGPGRDAASLRERARAIIRAEVDKLNPTDDARHPLELIIESSVRYAEVDGEVAITVVDQKGQPRTIERDGETVSYTLHDLLEEFRVSHPVLFRASGDARRHEAEKPAPVSDAPQEKPEPVEPAPRDWLNLGSAEDPSQPADGGTLFSLRRSGTRLRGWSRRMLRSWRTSAAVKPAPPLADRVQGSLGIVSRMPDGPAPRRAGFALAAALAVAALLGIAAFAFLGEDRPVQEAGLDEPVVTGAVPPAMSASAGTSTKAGTTNARTLRGAPDVLDTATLSLQGEVVRLFGVEWAPGGGKPDDLNRYLQGREVVCEAAGANDTYRCNVGGQDLSRVVLFNGGGRPTPEATAELKAAADRAREAKVGVWAP